MSFTQAQLGILKGVADALERMGELAMIANDETKTTDDRTAYNEEYKQLYSFIEETVTKSFNGRELYDNEALQVSAGASACRCSDSQWYQSAAWLYADGTTWPPVTTDDDGNEVMRPLMKTSLPSIEVARKVQTRCGWK